MCSKIGKRYNKDKCPFQSQDAMFWNSFNTQLMKNEQTSSLCFEKTGNVPFKVCQVDYVHLEADLVYI